MLQTIHKRATCLAARKNRILGHAGVILVLVTAAWFYAFMVRASGQLAPGALGDYYPLLVEGLRTGNLHVPVEPDPRLVALSDPYDPAQNHAFRLADASYYKGKYYLYFGITPAAVLMLPYRLLSGQEMKGATAVYVFCLIGIIAASGVWLALRRRYFPDSRWWTAGLGVGVIAFGSHVLAVAQRPCVWELPIAAAYACLMLMLLCLYGCLHTRRPVLLFVLAAFFLGLAVGARPTMILTAGALVIVLAFMRRGLADRGWLWAALGAALILGLLLAGLAAYNYARFDSPFEFGQRYQLTSLKEGEVPHYSAGFVGYNLRAYFAWPVRWTADWPFIASRPLPPAPPGYFSGEEMYCLALLAPVLWFAPAGALALWLARARAEPGLRAMVLAMAAVSLPLGGFMLFFFYAAQRYMVDFVPTLMLFALTGALVLERELARVRKVIRLTFAVAATATIVFGILASFDYHGRSLRQTAPREWQRAADATEPVVDAILEWFTVPSGSGPTRPATR